ncbi:hypothetical protein K4P20_12560 [Staphylococcus epidermidis]|nr:hypothetical protein [Staphylococcus epidermidis]
MYRIKIKKQLVEKMDEQIEQSNVFSARKQYLTYLCERISKGVFDELANDRKSSMYVYGEKENVTKARERARKLGYDTLQDMLDDVVNVIE